MLKLYTAKQAQNIIRKNETLIENICSSYSLPPACLKAILMMEIPEIDLLDLLADATVSLNWFRDPHGAGCSPDRRPRSPLRKYDSSTGYGQIFSRVAIEAILFAGSMGIPVYTGTPEALFPFRPEDLKQVWKRLKHDRVFNLSCSALNLLHAAYQMTEKTDLFHAGEAELKLTFSRYNGNVKKITPYGEKAYHYYVSFLRQN